MSTMSTTRDEQMWRDARTEPNERRKARAHAIMNVGMITLLGISAGCQPDPERSTDTSDPQAPPSMDIDLRDRGILERRAVCYAMS